MGFEKYLSLFGRPASSGLGQQLDCAKVYKTYIEKKIRDLESLKTLVLSKNSTSDNSWHGKGKPYRNRIL